ncbi:MAG TPA: NusA N-terminal domain-containing protein, partial [Vicinamibacterales bacterium]|nr:NusA N-terminal domain-containing protein [Vicinamibacterales bacterium]
MAGSSNPVQQAIEALAKERGIEPQVVIAAMEDAVLTSARKVFRAGESLKARFNPETGHVDLVAERTVVETVENPATEISLAEAKETYTEAYGEEVAAGIELGDEMEFP